MRLTAPARWFAGLAVLFGAIVAPHVTLAAILSPMPVDVSVDVGRTVSVTLTLDSQAESINVVSSRVNYSKDILDVESVSRAGSFLTLWPDPPVVDAAAGTVSFSGGIPNGTVTASGRVLTIVFRSKVRGTAHITFDPQHTDVYKNDGAGTKATVTTRASTVTVRNQDSLTPQLSSPTHPDESHWYQGRTLTVNWQRYDGAFYSYTLSREATAAPDDTAEQTDGSATYPNLSDGVWYFTLKEKFGDDPWGTIATYRAMIDGTAPEPIEASVIRDEASRTWLLSFTAIDATSGLAESVVVERRPLSPWFPFVLREDRTVTSTPYRLHDQHRLSELRIMVTDAAGNTRTLQLPNSGLTRQRWYVSAFYLVLVVIVVLVVFRLRRRRSQFVS